MRTVESDPVARGRVSNARRRTTDFDREEIVVDDRKYVWTERDEEIVAKWRRNAVWDEVPDSVHSAAGKFYAAFWVALSVLYIGVCVALMWFFGTWPLVGLAILCFGCLRAFQWAKRR
jgi:hypothetical protein